MLTSIARDCFFSAAAAHTVVYWMVAPRLHANLQVPEFVHNIQEFNIR